MTSGAAIQAPRLATAAELAAQLGVSRAYVYEHAERLGAIRLGRGPRARLRFDPHEVMRDLRVSAINERANVPARKAARSKTPRLSATTTSRVSLLPIKDAGIR